MAKRSGLDLLGRRDLFELDMEQGLAVRVGCVEGPAPRLMCQTPADLPRVLTLDPLQGLPSGNALSELLDRTPLVTLTGPGGTGKTRLALQVAAERLTSFADGAYVVELAPISDPGLVASAIASALTIREQADRPLVDTLKGELRDRELLLVLDNFEQVTPAASLVTDLLGSAPRLRILVTSRAVLHVRGEHEFPVAPLRIPDPSSLPPLEALSHYEGVALFVERAMATRPDFTITPESAPAIAEIVARLDGLPLAIELAAAKARLLGPEAILGRLGSRLAFLGGGPRDPPARQQTLRQAIDWSYTLLSEEQQAFMSRLSVFVGGWTIDAAAAVVDDLGIDAFEGLAMLVDQSLVRREEESAGEPRFLMLETIREYALERLSESGKLEEIRRRHATYFLSVAEAIEPQLLRSPEEADRIAHDHDNFRAVLSWAIDTDDADLGLRLGYALWRFWQQRAHLREGRDWFERLLDMPGAADRSAARAKGLSGAAGIAYWQNDYEATQAWYAEAEDIIRGLDDPVWLSDALYNSGTVAALVGDMQTVAAKLGEGIAIGRQLGDDAIIGRFLAAEGYMAFMSDDLARARELLEEGLAVAERQGDQGAIAMGHNTVAQVARLDGRLTDAADHYREALRYWHQLGDASQLTEPLQGLAAVAIAGGDAERGVAAARYSGSSDASRPASPLWRPMARSSSVDDRDRRLLGINDRLLRGPTGVVARRSGPQLAALALDLPGRVDGVQCGIRRPGRRVIRVRRKQLCLSPPSCGDEPQRSDPRRRCTSVKEGSV